MKTINFTHKDTNLYHLLKEEIVSVSDQMMQGKATITGYSKETMQDGDSLIIYGCKYTITGEPQRRDHRGVFNNPEDAKGGFFSVETSFERIVQKKN